MTPTDINTCRALVTLLKAAGEVEEAERWEPRQVLDGVEIEAHKLDWQQRWGPAEAPLPYPESDPPLGFACPAVTTDETLRPAMERACEKAGRGTILVAPHPLPIERDEWGYMAIWMEGGVSTHWIEANVGHIAAKGPAHFGGTPSLALCAAIEAAGGGS